MLTAIRARLTYANTAATVALFMALGGGAYAASGGLLSSSGDVRGCVKPGGGVLHVVRARARCARGTIPLTLATPYSAALKGPRGPRGATGPRGHRGYTGPLGPAGPQGPQGTAGTAAYAFSLGPVNWAADHTSAATFAGNEMRLVCGNLKCAGQVLVVGAMRAVGSDSRGEVNGAPVTKLVDSATPAQATLTEIEGKGGPYVSEGVATVSLANRSGWDIQVELRSDALGNVVLIGTAVAGSVTPILP